MTHAARAVGGLLAVASASLLGLAAGAMWMVPMMWLRADLPMLAVPLGALLGWTMARWVAPRRGTAALLAAWATVLACSYVALLLATARLAGSLDLGLAEAAGQAGLAMLAALAWLALTPAQLLWFAAGAATAAWAGRRAASG